MRERIFTPMRGRISTPMRGRISTSMRGRIPTPMCPLISEHGCRRRSRARAFTLVEVLVAMTIAAIALMTAMRATGSLAVNSAELRSRTLAQWSAENRLAQIRIAVEWPSTGRRQFDCSQAGVELVCREDVFQTPNPLFRRVEVSVYRPDSTHRLSRLVGFATRRQ